MKNDHTHPPTSHPYSVPSFLPATCSNFISKFHQNKIADIAVIFFHDFTEWNKNSAAWICMLRSGKGRKQNVNDFPLPYLSLSSPRIAFGSWGSGRKQKGTKGMGWGWGLRGIFEFDFNVASSSAQLRRRRMVLQGGAKIIVLESEKNTRVLYFKHHANSFRGSWRRKSELY